MIRSVGICNLRMRQLEQYHAKALSFDILQIERHPLRTCLEEEAFCRNHGITIQAYSPLCKMDDRIRQSDVLARLSEKYQKDIGQIILRWQLDSGFIPIFASTKTSRIAQYGDIFDFSLDPDEIREINQMNINYKMYLESVACPGF